MLFDEQEKLFAYMKTFEGIKFMSVEGYIKIWSNVEVSEKGALHAKWQSEREVGKKT